MQFKHANILAGDEYAIFPFKTSNFQSNFHQKLSSCYFFITSGKFFKNSSAMKTRVL